LMKAAEQRVLRIIRAAAAARMVIGVGMTLMTRRLVTAAVSEAEPSGPLLLFARTVGIRDALFGLGCLLATGDDRRSDLRRWVGIWAANESADVRRSHGRKARGTLGRGDRSCRAAAIHRDRRLGAAALA